MPEPGRCPMVASTAIRRSRVACTPGSWKVMLSPNDSTATLSYPAVTTTFVGTVSAPRSTLNRTCLIRVGAARVTSSHWSAPEMSDADCHEVPGSPSRAAKGWCSGRVPPRTPTCDRGLDAGWR